MRDAGVQVLSLTPAQLTASAAAVALLSPNVQLSQVITAAQAASSPVLDVRFFNFTVEDSVANVLANITAIDALMRAGQLGKLRFAEGTANLTMTAAQFSQAALVLSQILEDLQGIVLSDAGTPTVTIAADVLSFFAVRANALNFITGPFALAVTGSVSAGMAAAILSENTRVLANLGAGSLRIADFASNVVSNISALNTLAGQGKLVAIDLINTGVPGLGISNGVATANSAVLALISSPFTVAAAPATTPQSLSAAQVVAQLSSLVDSAHAGTLGAITLIDGGTPTLSMTTGEFTTGAAALVKIIGEYAISLTDSNTVSLQSWQLSPGIANVLNRVNFTASPTLVINGAINAATATTIAANAGPEASFTPGLRVLDFASNIASNIAGLQTLATNGWLVDVKLLDNGIGRLVLTAAQAVASPGALAAITSPVLLSMNVTAAGAAAAAVPSGAFDVLTVVDSVANIQANLSALQPLAATGKLSNISFTGSAPFVFNLSAAQVGANAEVLLRAGTNYSIALSDGGTPTVTLREWQTAGNIANLLNRITSPYSLRIDGPIRPQRVSTLVAAGATNYNNLLPNSLVVRDYPTAFRGRMSDLLTLANAGKIEAIDTRGGRPVFSLDAGEQTTFASVLSLIATPFTLSQNVTVAGIESTSSTMVARLWTRLRGSGSTSCSWISRCRKWTDSKPRPRSGSANGKPAGTFESSR